ncbi:MAG: FMN-binding protein, partial [Clostridiales bacterium]|nr:FMN-binding protein [Clostridiales bacterium]
MAESQPEAPAHPFPYAELDLDEVERIAYEGYFENGCCYGVAKGLLAELCKKVGFPYTMIPPEMFANGKEGYTAGTLCGALGGAAGVIGLCCAPDDARAITKELFAWYTSTPLPIYQPEGDAPVQTISTTVNCVDSVSNFMTAADVERADPIRKRRCGGVSGDVARKTAELLNIHYGFMAAPAVAEAETELAANEYIGEANGFGGPIKVKVTMDGDKIAKIDVLSHGDTPGICDKAFATIPQAIIDAQSTQVDVAAGATFSSKGIMAAVEDALSKVGK